MLTVATGIHAPTEKIRWRINNHSQTVKSNILSEEVNSEWLLSSDTCTSHCWEPYLLKILECRNHYKIKYKIKQIWRKGLQSGPMSRDKLCHWLIFKSTNIYNLENLKKNCSGHKQVDIWLIHSITYILNNQEESWWVIDKIKVMAHILSKQAIKDK